MTSGTDPSWQRGRVTTWDAVVLAGGEGRRLGGVDKPALRHGGRTLLEGVLAACRGARSQVVVGPPRSLPAEVVQVREDPPGGGPLAALAAALPHLGAPAVVLLAADLPLLTYGAVQALLAAVDGHDVALAVDDTGHDQYLCGAWRTEVLHGEGRRVRDLLAGRDVVRVALPGQPWRDVDTPEDLARWSVHPIG